MSGSQMVVLDVGGQFFRTTRSTLTLVDSFFSRMLSSDWREGQSGGGADGETSGECSSPGGPVAAQPLSIFIDRDPLCFPAILSYLRSQRVFIPGDADKVWLEKLLVEADYYQLETLSARVSEEIAKRLENEDQSDTMDAQDVYRSISPSEVQAHFEQGWAFVNSYEANETAACSATGSKVTATWRNNTCTVCGFNMSYEKFVKHASFFKPTVVVVRRPKRGARSFSAYGGFTPYGGIGLGGAVGGGGERVPTMGMGLLGSPIPGGGGGGGGFVAAIPIAFGALDTDASFG